MTLFPNRLYPYILLVATVFVCACAPVQVVSEQSLQAKLAEIKLGVTAKPDIERIFGTEHGNENLRWIYNLSDSGGIFPIAAATRPTHAQALITVRFSANGTVNGLEVARYIKPPFSNDYWYTMEGKSQNILELAARAGEAGKFRVVDKSINNLSLEDASNGRITVAFANDILHINSTNPHDRLSNEYRVFSKREGALIETILAAPANVAIGRELNASSRAPAPPSKKPAQLSWQNNSNNADGFRVYRITGAQKTKIAELQSSATSYTDKDPPPKACYVVTAFNAAGESPATSKVCLPD
jgi:hypothetical protein